MLHEPFVRCKTSDYELDTVGLAIFEAVFVLNLIIAGAGNL